MHRPGGGRGGTGEGRAGPQEVSRGGKHKSVAFADSCSCPKAEETAPPPKCQLWPLNSRCGEIPQVAMLTPPQEASDVDTFGPGTS